MRDMADSTTIEPFEVVPQGDKILAQLSRIRDGLVEKAENISMRLEDLMDPAVASRLSGDERAKARHLYVTQAKKLETELNKLGALVEKFRVHIY